MSARYVLLLYMVISDSCLVFFPIQTLLFHFPLDRNELKPCSEVYAAKPFLCFGSEHIQETTSSKFPMVFFLVDSVRKLEELVSHFNFYLKYKIIL